MPFKISITIVSILMLVSTAFAADSGLTSKIQNKYDSIQSFSADFIQTLTTAASGEQEIRKGSILFKQPSLLRWDTVSPEKELLMVGKSYVWDYYPEDQLAMKYHAEQVFNSKTMIKFISGQANLAEDFVIENQGDDHGLIKLKLIPKEPEPGLVLGYVWVDSESSMLMKVLSVDFYGNGNEVDLSNINLEPKVSDSDFEFTPPEGVNIEDNTADN
ncbi:outer membrane lipoprotein chaperone LolA [Maridesulfovibrio bastinii]|uniref:outer membrane lipoprotein chaperone LolA n=1 Tax=Maridesulfovibrio bastinii TaxID=47157 RepID=UPI0003FE327F|nr:outer membrane lipoprotein chaperone LolA [Maridesulfovibrio bastinii]